MAKANAELQDLLPRSADGEQEASWIVADYIDVVLHVFTPDAREYYRLEELWDDVPHDWGRNATPELLAKAKAVPPSKAQVDMLAALWAGETVRLSNNAFKGLTFGSRNDQGKWPATVDNAFLYRTKLENMQRQQIIKGGARLAELLREIWPEE